MILQNAAYTLFQMEKNNVEFCTGQKSNIIN